MKNVLPLLASLLAGSAFASTGHFQLVSDQTTCVPCEQVQTYQTLTITEPRIRWRPEIEYTERQVQVPQVQTYCTPQVQTQTCVPQIQTQYVAPTVTTQCVPQVQTQCVVPQYVGGQCTQPTNYVQDSDLGTNMRYEPAVLRTEDGYERVMRTPIRSATTIIRAGRQHMDRDPPIGGPSSFR